MRLSDKFDKILFFYYIILKIHINRVSQSNFYLAYNVYNFLKINNNNFMRLCLY